MTNRDKLFARSIKCSSSSVMVTMLLISPSIDSSVDLMSTARGSAFVRWFSDCCLSYFGSKVMFGELILSVSQDSSYSRLFHRSIAALLVVVYSSDVGVVSKGNCRQRKASMYTITMQVNTVVAFAWIWW